MSNFSLLGRVVTHTARPRFRAVMTKLADGSYVTGEAHGGQPVEWLDGQPEATPENARLLARFLREAGEYFVAHMRGDWIQEAVIEAAREQGLTPYAIAKATGWAVSDDHVRDYLERRKSMGSHKLQHVLQVLGITLNPARIRRGGGGGRARASGEELGQWPGPPVGQVLVPAGGH